MNLLLSCRQCVALIVAREDRVLTTGEKLALQLHLSRCKLCPRFARQLAVARQALDEWKSFPRDGAPRDDMRTWWD